MSKLLKIANLKAWYGQSQVLFGVELEINEGQVVSLMGRNGMGKSTTIMSICGMMDRCEGSINFRGTALIGLASHKAARLGLGLVPEGRRAFSNLTVRENLTAAAIKGPWDLHRVHNMFPRLQERASQSAGTLSGGEQQMLVIGRALMTNPRLLILDEATEGLAPVIRREIWAAVRKLKSEGMSILLVDKTLRELLAVADNCFVLERGKTVWTGVPTKLTTDIANTYLGV